MLLAQPEERLAGGTERRLLVTTDGCSVSSFPGARQALSLPFGHFSRHAWMNFAFHDPIQSRPKPRGGSMLTRQDKIEQSGIQRARFGIKGPPTAATSVGDQDVDTSPRSRTARIVVAYSVERHRLAVRLQGVVSRQRRHCRVFGDGAEASP